VWASVRDSVWDSVWASVRDSVWDSVWDSVGASVRASVRASVWDSVRASVNTNWDNYFGGRTWCDWEAFFSFFRDVAQHQIDGDTWDRSHAYQDAQSAGWWWPMRDFVMVCDVPTELHIESAGGRHRMHCETGPAILWADGWGIHMWHGTRVPADLIETDWDIEKIMAEKNAEIRRCAIEKLGWDQFVTAGGFTLTDEAPDPGNPGQVLRLYDVPRHVLDLPVRVLVAHNATRERDGTRHTFGLTIPTDCRTAVAAAAWTFDLTEREYKELARAT
jgi:hypothetical protein